MGEKFSLSIKKGPELLAQASRVKAGKILFDPRYYVYYAAYTL